jgi:hypothetical protein
VPPGISINPCSSSSYLRSVHSRSHSGQLLNGNSQIGSQGAAPAAAAAMAVPISSAMNLSGFSGRSVVAQQRPYKRSVGVGGGGCGGEKSRVQKKHMAWPDAAGCRGCSRVSVRGFRTEEEKALQGLPDISVRSVFTEMKGKYGAFGGGATLEKSKLDLSQSTSRVSPQVFPRLLSLSLSRCDHVLCHMATARIIVQLQSETSEGRK